MTKSVLPVLLCGGSGARLWPLSREAFPKQFLNLGLGKSLIRQALERANHLSDQVLCIAGEAHRFFVAAAMEAEGCKGRIVLEPAARNTAAAVAVATIEAVEVNSDTVLVIMPADAYVADPKAFSDAMSRAAYHAARSDDIVLIGVSATSPSTAYGYIEPDVIVDESNICSVRSFHEKPDRPAATSFVERGYLWNSGVFVARASTFVNAFQEHAPDVFVAAQRAFVGAVKDGQFRRLEKTAYSEVPEVQVDTALIEKAPKLALVSFAGTWSDLGTWSAVADVFPSDASENRIVGDVFAENSSRNLIVAKSRLVATLGVDDLIIVDTPDAMLVAAKPESGSIKNLVTRLVEASRHEALVPMVVERPWGSYEVLAAASTYQMKEIKVKPGASLSLQYHHHRSEHWVVTVGEAEVTCNDRVFRLKENESTFIPQGAVHQLYNPTETTLVMIEVQHGAYLGEDDIVRLDKRNNENIPNHR